MPLRRTKHTSADRERIAYKFRDPFSLFVIHSDERRHIG